MFIYVAYKDAPELSTFRRKSSETDLSMEKTLLVNPNCPVRIMLEYIRKKVKLADATQFDLCDEGGRLKGLFNRPAYTYATQLFDHKSTYYLIVLRQESEKLIIILPQVNRENRLYNELQAKVRRFLLTGDTSPQATPPGKATPPAPSTRKRK